MTPHDAWLYAATWGSYMSAGDPGACMYGFDEKFEVQSENHRAACLAEMEKNRARVVALPEDFEPGELELLDDFVEALKRAPLANRDRKGDPRNTR